MSTLELIPDIEAAVNGWVRNHQAVAALGARVAGATPKSFTRPWVKVVQLDAAPEPTAVHEWLIRYTVQLDCYAGSDQQTGQAQASTLGRTVRAALGQLTGAALTGLVVSAVVIVGDARIPDETFDPWRERRVLTAQVYAHSA